MTSRQFGSVYRPPSTNSPARPNANATVSTVRPTSNGNTSMIRPNSMNTFSSSSSSNRPSTFSSGNKVKKALLVGIRYLGSESELGGCWNDIAQMHGILRGVTLHYDDVVIMTDYPQNVGTVNYPSTKNFTDMVSKILKSLKSGDTFFLHYSGHGTQVTDRDGDEKYSNEVAYDEDTNRPILDRLNNLTFEKVSMDEAICLWNGRQIEFFTDDNLHELLVKNTPDGVKVRVFFDCCCSGSALDLPFNFNSPMGGVFGKAVQSERFLRDRSGRLTNWYQEMDPADQRYLSIQKKNIIYISGCQDRQVSIDASIGGKAMGSLTRAIINILQKLISSDDLNKTTWPELIILIAKQITGYRTVQRPQMSASNLSIADPGSTIGSTNVRAIVDL